MATSLYATIRKYYVTRPEGNNMPVQNARNVRTSANGDSPLHWSWRISIVNNWLMYASLVVRDHYYHAALISSFFTSQSMLVSFFRAFRTAWMEWLIWSHALHWYKRSNNAVQGFYIHLSFALLIAAYSITSFDGVRTSPSRMQSIYVLVFLKIQHVPALRFEHPFSESWLFFRDRKNAWMNHKKFWMSGYLSISLMVNRFFS